MKGNRARQVRRGCAGAIQAFPATAAAVVTLGERDFNEGDFPVTTYNGRQTGEPAPFDGFIGRDQDLTDTVLAEDFSASWTFNYAPLSISSATLTLGLYDHDSASPGSQVGGFFLDSLDLTGLLNSALEARGGGNAVYNIYTLTLPASTFTTLEDGVANFSLRLVGPTLGGTSGDSVLPKNGAGLDFATLAFNGGDSVSVPEPSSLALLFGSFFSLAALSRRRRSD
ncbi:MAG TPA: PEP-CTERM sorting domain-containing protein [Rhodocyclaceae bacterium]|nr:PEP-CTERM sorting domain-containing protein [Rhodocyclaceae bacterium]